MSVWTEKDFASTRRSLYDRLPVPIIEALSSEREYWIASSNGDDDLWWVCTQDHRLLLYLGKSNQAVELPFTESSMDARRSASLMTSSDGTDFCAVLCSSDSITSIRYWPRIRKQPKAHLYFDYEIDCPDFVPAKFIGKNGTFVLSAANAASLFFTVLEDANNTFSLKSCVHMGQMETEPTKTPFLSDIKKRLTSILRPQLETNLFEKQKVFLHLFESRALICTETSAYLYSIDGQNSNRFRSELLAKIILNEAVSQCSEVMEFQGNIVCAGMQGLQNTVHLLMQSRDNPECLFHVAAMLDSKGSSLVPLSCTRLYTPVDVFGRPVAFVASSSNRHLMLYNDEFACILSGKSFSQLCLIRFGGRMCSSPYFKGNYLMIADKQEGLCDIDLPEFCFCSDGLWETLVRPDDEVGRLYLALCLHARNQDAASYLIIEDLMKRVDINQIVARLAMAICDLYMKAELDGSIASDQAVDAFSTYSDACARKKIVFKCLLQLLSTGDQSVVITLADGTERPMDEMLRTLYEALFVAEALFNGLLTLEADDQTRIFPLVQENPKVTQIAKLLSSVIRLRPAVPPKWMNALFNQLICIKGEISEEINTLSRLEQTAWSLTESESFALDICELIVAYTSQLADDPVVANFAVTFLDAVRNLPSDTWKLLTSTVINALDQAGQADRALVIAERYKEWVIFIKICVEHSLFDEIVKMCDLYGKDMIVELVRRFRQAGKMGLLLQEPFIKCRAIQEKISSECDMFWILSLRNGKYSKAFEGLRDISMEETRLQPKQIQLGICRLMCTLAGISSPWLDKEQLIVYGCSLLPESLYKKLNLQCCHPLDPEVLVKALCDDCIPAAEKPQCFATAMQLLSYCGTKDSLSRRDLEINVVSSCLLCDSWHEATDELDLTILNPNAQFIALISYIHKNGIHIEPLSINGADVFARNRQSFRDKGLTARMISTLLECITI